MKHVNEIFIFFWFTNLDILMALFKFYSVQNNSKTLAQIEVQTRLLLFGLSKIQKAKSKKRCITSQFMRFDNLSLYFIIYFSNFLLFKLIY